MDVISELTSSKKEPLTNFYAWLIALWPFPAEILGAILLCGWIYSSMLMVLTLLPFVFDRNGLKKAGYQNIPSFWWVFIPPVYFWKRATLTGQKNTLMYVFMIAIFLAVMTSFLMERYYPEFIPNP